MALTEAATMIACGLSEAAEEEPISRDLTIRVNAHGTDGTDIGSIETACCLIRR